MDIMRLDYTFSFLKNIEQSRKTLDMNQVQTPIVVCSVWFQIGLLEGDLIKKI
jgi:hypothetical protein